MAARFRKILLQVTIVLCINHHYCSARNRPPLGALVPTIETDNYALKPNGNGYNLRITLPDGSVREETTFLDLKGMADGKIAITGLINNIFGDTNGELTLNYSAGEGGYAAKYRYSIGKQAPGIRPLTRPTITPPSPPTPPSTTQPTPPPLPQATRPPAQSINPGALKSAAG